MRPANNVLGELTAESDHAMLQSAFFESASFRELVSGRDFRFVVGRRGAGKSALFQKVYEVLREQPSVLVLSEHPSEEKVLAFQAELERITSSYLEVRHITKVTWKAQILFDALAVVLKNYKAKHLEQYAYLSDAKAQFAEVFAHDGLARSLHALRLVLRTDASLTAKQLPEKIADFFRLNTLQTKVCEALRALEKRVVFLYDGLDEGWTPSQPATGLIGGLAKAASEFRESAGHLHCVLFIRDNMLRALAQFDGDYTRNIEGSTLRLQWDEDNLLQLVANRLRTAFAWRDEQAIKVWNRFAQRGLEGREGFQRCLKLTLYRPRDVIALLNGAYQEAGRSSRDRIIDTDIDNTAVRISRARLSDLYKEYETVLPGLASFAEDFRGGAGSMRAEEAFSVLDAETQQPHAGAPARDYALLSSGEEALNALYSVGFLGIQKESSATVRFCHDGSNTSVDKLTSGQTVFVHPCYWRALDIASDTAEQVLVRIDDEDDAAVSMSSKTKVQDLRLRKLGRVVEDLGKIPLGLPGAHEFEEWVLTTARYLFAASLDNIQRNPNPGALQRRDIVGTNREGDSFWRRMARDYHGSQFVIECKNFQEMDVDVFRQCWGYLVPPYGRCLMVVTRSEGEKITQKERALVVEGWTGSERKLVLLIPAFLLQRALSKMRSRKERRDDYTTKVLNDRLDTFERSYVSLKAERR